MLVSEVKKRVFFLFDGNIPHILYTLRGQVHKNLSEEYFFSLAVPGQGVQIWPKYFGFCDFSIVLKVPGIPGTTMEDNLTQDDLLRGDPGT